ncbi:MAG: SRPBCC family protein [Deltaproteobacteria bacterium]|nr:SRPBCC family protein [Deltaproteobacteria bacterium]
MIVALQPSDFTVSRSITVSAPPEAAFAQVNDFRKWAGWNRRT